MFFNTLCKAKNKPMELRLPSHFGGTVADYGFRSTLRILVVDSMEAMGSVVKKLPPPKINMKYFLRCSDYIAVVIDGDSSRKGG